MTCPADNKDYPIWTFDYYYDSYLGGELYKHGKGQGDEVCTSVPEGSECSVLNHPNGLTYITDVAAGTCCIYPMHLGMIRSDWLIRSNATYSGLETINYLESDIW